MPTHNVPYDLCHVPVHRLNTPQTKCWFLGGSVRRQMVSMLSKRYSSGVGVLTASCYLIAFVAPDGRVRELPPPLRRFEMYQIANRPSPGDCQCLDFYDPETGGPWRMRDSEHHHPMCQFEPVGMAVFQEAQKQAAARVGEGKPAQARPDEWERIRQNYKEK